MKGTGSVSLMLTEEELSFRSTRVVAFCDISPERAIVD
jgi:hypothetical protein